LNNIKRNFYNIIEKGTYKGKRVYYEDECGCDQMLPVELYYLFKNAFDNNYKVYYLYCSPNHDIEFTQSELNFLKSEIEFIGGDKIIENHIFSKEVLKIKE
jgi:hypothetical protein